MKKFLVMLGVSALATLTTQGAYANNAEKIAVVKKFLHCHFNEECHGTNGTNATKRFLSKSAIAVLNYERQHAELSEDCSAVVPRCYSSIWTIPAVDWDSNVAKKSMKISVAKSGIVVAKFQIIQGSNKTAHFKIIKENGQWKIDNTTRAWEERHESWWR